MSRQCSVSARFRFTVEQQSAPANGGGGTWIDQPSASHLLEQRVAAGDLELAGRFDVELLTTPSSISLE